MSKTFATVVYEIFSQEKDVVTLRDFVADKYQIAYKRLLPKRTKDFPGMEKTEQKLTLSDPVLGTIGIVTVSTSIRADQLPAVKTALLAQSLAMQGDATYTSLVMDQKLPFNV